MLVFVLRQTTWLLLLPWVYGLSKAVVELVLDSSLWSPEIIALIAGAAVAVIASRLFHPLGTIYVAGHELTHALWAILFGKRVSAIAVRKSGGHVVLSGTNSLITLAPYFFPFYGVVWLVVVTGLGLWTPFRVADWAIAFGFGGLFMLHLLMTGKVLQLRQPDIESEGHIFSAVVIVLGNLATGAILCLLALKSPRLGRLVGSAWENSGACLGLVERKTGQLFGSLGIL